MGRARSAYVEWFGKAYVSSTRFFGFKVAGPSGLARVEGDCQRGESLTVCNTGISRVDVLWLLDVCKAFLKAPMLKNSKLICRLPAQIVAGRAEGRAT